MNTYPNPSATKRGWLELSKGLDVINSLALVNPQAMTKASNIVYRDGTLTRRAAFRELTDEAFTGETFTGATSYIDSNDTERIIFGLSGGDLMELDLDGSSTVLASGFSSRVRFQNMRGACFAVDGSTLFRGDADTWREAGAPAYIDDLTGVSDITVSTAIAGDYTFIVVPVIEDSGTAILKGDWSNIVTVAVTDNTSAKLDWTDVSDTRVTHYYIYRTLRDLGTPFYYDGKVTAGTETYTSSCVDTTLSEQVSDPAGRNGQAPDAELITVSGQRLVLAKLSDDSAAVHLSAIATNNYEMEYFPTDGLHRFTLPNNGPVTACIGLGVKDEDDNRNDLFLSQLDSCYLLRSTDPNGTLETVSANVGCINPDAVCQWGGFLFFVSKRGVEFIGPTGKPLMISKMVNPFLWGGGSRTLSGITGYDYISLTAFDNKLLLSFRQDSGINTQDSILVLDLESFDPNYPEDSARWTEWDGLGFSHFVETKERDLILFDNIYQQILKSEKPSSVIGYDSINGVDSPIACSIWTGAQLAFDLQSQKCIRTINAFIICDQQTDLTVETNYGEVIDSISLIPDSNGIDWDVIWDAVWTTSDSFMCSEPVSRDAIGRFFQFKFDQNVISGGFIFLGFTLEYTAQKVVNLKRR
jgi:hypothetical protein